MDDMSVTIRKVEFWPVDVPITDPFVVATGARTMAENVFLRVTLAKRRHFLKSGEKLARAA